jgi:peptidoglycan/LPS O-acetylase OafA/YrhL
MIYVVGIKTFDSIYHTADKSGNFSGAVIAALITSLIVVIPLAELFHQLVTKPSKKLAHHFYDFITA